jgi:hypothetical protein
VIYVREVDFVGSFFSEFGRILVKRAGILLLIVFLLRSLEIRECVLLQIIVATSSVIVQGAQAIQDAMGNITGSRKLIDILP